MYCCYEELLKNVLNFTYLNMFIYKYKDFVFLSKICTYYVNHYIHCSLLKMLSYFISIDFDYHEALILNNGDFNQFSYVWFLAILTILWFSDKILLYVWTKCCSSINIKFHKLLIIWHFVWGHIVGTNNHLEYNYNSLAKRYVNK